MPNPNSDIQTPPADKRMPRPGNTPNVSPRVLQALLIELERFKADEAKVRAEYPWASRFVMGLPLAPWQRDFKWTSEQSQRFITSAWTGVPLGTYVLTELRIQPGNDVVFEPLANCVIEGQQRLRALELYFNGQLAVPDAQGVPTRWSEVGRLDRMWFQKTVFNCGITPESDERKLREYYDLLNFGGTAHEEYERALVSDEDVEHDTSSPRCSP